jgi:hypothetical protein
MTPTVCRNRLPRPGRADDASKGRAGRAAATVVLWTAWCGWSALTLGGCGGAAASNPGREPAAATSTPAEAAAATSPPAPARGKAAAATSKPSVAAQPRDITFDTIKFEMQKGDPFVRSMLTPQIEALHGKPVRIRGYILPSFQQTGITQFVLVRDNLQCCFGPGAALYDCIVVDMRPGKSADYTVRPVTVAGTFEIRELRDPDGKDLAIYHLDGDAVE